MTDSLVPDWIKNIKQQEEHRTAKQEAEALRSELAGRIIKGEGPALWRQLIKELQITVDNLPVIGLSGSVTSTGSEQDESYEIAVTKATSSPARISTNIFYAPGAPLMRIYTAEHLQNLIFGANDGKAVFYYGAVSMDAEKTAAFIVKPMAESLIVHRPLS